MKVHTGADEHEWTTHFERIAGDTPWPSVRGASSVKFPWQQTQPESYRFEALAQYNGERSRGIVHTPEYQAEMAEEQRRFYEAEGYEFWDDKGDGIVGRGPHGWIAAR